MAKIGVKQVHDPELDQKRARLAALCVRNHPITSHMAWLQGTEGPWAAAFAQAMSGSPGLYSQTEPAEGEWWANNGGRKWKGGRAPAHSINFVTAHDGFSLADLTAYNEKHNDANGEDNRYTSLDCKLLLLSFDERSGHKSHVLFSVPTLCWLAKGS